MLEGRGVGDVATSQGMSGATRRWIRQEGSSPKPQESQPCNALSGAPGARN